MRRFLLLSYTDNTENRLLQTSIILPQCHYITRVANLRLNLILVSQSVPSLLQRAEKLNTCQIVCALAATPSIDNRCATTKIIGAVTWANSSKHEVAESGFRVESDESWVAGVLFGANAIALCVFR